MTRVHLETELVMRRRLAQRELWQVLSGPSRWHHCRADLLIGRIDRLEYVADELAREWAA